MKRKFKRIASLVLAMVMVFAMAMPGMAADLNGTNLSLTIEGVASDDHTFTAYQIFTGTLNTETVEGNAPGTMLSTAQWGSGITKEGQNYMLDLAKRNGAPDAETATDVAAWLGGTGASKLKEICDELVKNGYLTAGKAVSASTGSDNNYTYVIDELSTGYYMVTDAITGTEGTDDAVSAYMVRLLQSESMHTKATVPSVEKFVKDANNSEGTTTDWGKSADHDYGDVIDFKLEATLGSDAESFDAYDTYYFAFHDEQSAGLTFIPDSVKVYIDGATEPIASSLYTVETTGLGDDCTFEIIFNDLKAVPGVKEGTVIRVEYQSTLNENAQIGNPGNPNEVTLEYSNNPNGAGHGTTPPDKVTVFTFDITVNKTDGTNPLTGAAFKLEKFVKATSEAEGTWEEVKDARKEVTASGDVAASVFNFKFVDDGLYKLTEIGIPDGYNEMTPNPVYIKVEATHTVKEVEAEGLKATAGTLNEEGEFTPFGEGEGFTFTINTTNSDDGKIGTFGQASTDVVNQKGATLPETGGIGTTIFYVVGSVLVLGAVILLVTKRRMKG